MSPKNKNMLRISELAERAQVSVPTIKHYVHEGLIDKPVKTGKTMAYYHESMVERVRSIKRLQREKFLPLDVIKRMLDSEGLSGEDAELGRAFFKESSLVPETGPVPETQVERRTEYPLEKVRVLEKEGLVRPLVAEEGKLYTAIDLRIIEIMKLREDLDVPFDHSLDTVRAYRDGVRQAVDRDLKLFATSLLGEIPARRAARLMTEADDSLDSFMVLYRRRLIRETVEEAVRHLNQLYRYLVLLNFLPIGEQADTDGGTGEKEQDNNDKVYCFFQSLLAADYAKAGKILRDGLAVEQYLGWDVLLSVLEGGPEQAVEKINKDPSGPYAMPFMNACAALAYVFAMVEATGFSKPLYILKRCLDHLHKIEEMPPSPDPENAFARYVCGCIYVMLPGLFDTKGKGIAMLEQLDKELKNGEVNTGYVPKRLDKTIRYRVFPEVRIRLNRFLAEAWLGKEDESSAAKALEALIRIAPWGSEHHEWARNKKAGL